MVLSFDDFSHFQPCQRCRQTDRGWGCGGGRGGEGIEEEKEKELVEDGEEELEEGGGVGRGRGGGVTRSYKEKANSNRPIGPYKAVRYLT